MESNPHFGKIDTSESFFNRDAAATVLARREVLFAIAIGDDVHQGFSLSTDHPFFFAAKIAAGLFSSCRWYQDESFVYAFVSKKRDSAGSFRTHHFSDPRFPERSLFIRNDSSDALIGRLWENRDKLDSEMLAAVLGRRFAEDLPKDSRSPRSFAEIAETGGGRESMADPEAGPFFSTAPKQVPLPIIIEIDFAKGLVIVRLRTEGDPVDFVHLLDGKGRILLAPDLW